MSKCYVKLIGGLGNQLFQLACGYAYASKYDKELFIAWEGWHAHQGNNPSVYRNTIFNNFEFTQDNLHHIPTYNEPSLKYKEIPYYDGDIVLSGYFQSYKYFEYYSDDFISKLSLPKFEKFDNAVALHIRRGDYLIFSNIHYVCDTEYFMRNIARFPDKFYHVFTDSKDHVMREFSNLNFKIVNSNSDLEDLAAMAAHENIICSNSSFSWWASLLGEKKDKVIVPDRWFNNRDDYEDIYRAEFIRG
jgi:hypothetical protein